VKVGDLVKAGDPDSAPGIVMKIDKDFYGAHYAFKTDPVPRGHAIRDVRKPDFIAKTAKGIRDRVLVLWPEHGFSYEESDVLEVISESR
tara:strand:+ start:443 stop:709 length:267 start_codon:yes stop_codon:yes gene_type:complete